MMDNNINNNNNFPYSIKFIEISTQIQFIHLQNKFPCATVDSGSMPANLLPSRRPLTSMKTEMKCG